MAQGGQFLGFWFGFRDIYLAGLSDRMPQLVAVQSEGIAPIYQAWRKGLAAIPAVIDPKPTVAEGISIPKPVRGKRLLQALRETNGRVITVNDCEILEAQQNLGHQGYYIEPTSAVAVAGLEKLKHELSKEAIVILILTGNGLKGAPQTM